MFKISFYSYLWERVLIIPPRVTRTHRIIVEWPNQKRHHSVHPNITSEHEIRDRSFETLTDVKATQYPIIMRFSTSGAEINAF